MTNNLNDVFVSNPLTSLNETDLHYVGEALGGGSFADGGITTANKRKALLKLAATELTVSSGAITITQLTHKIQPESGTSDELDTISGTAAGQWGILFISDDGTDSFTIKHGTGNLSCNGQTDIEWDGGLVVWYSDGTTVFISGGGGGGVSLSAVRVYTSNDTWTKPAGIDHVIVEVVGGGGGGGGCTSATSNAGCGMAGGGGEYAKARIAAASLGSTETVTVGAGGTAGAAGNNAGGTGGTSSFGAHVSAVGGSGGDGNTASSSFPFLGASTGGAGGSGGSGGDVTIPGSSGLNGIKWSASYVQPSIGGASFMSGMAKPETGSDTDENGVAGKQYGGGGTGARSSNDTTNRAGGAGAAGVVIVYEYTFA